MDKLIGLLGIAVRAGQAVFGEDSCMKALRSGQCEILLLDAAISGTVREKYAGVCERGDIPYTVLPEGTIATATGHSGMAVAIRKGSLGSRIRELDLTGEDLESTT